MCGSAQALAGALTCEGAQAWASAGAWVRVRAKRERVKLAVTQRRCSQPPGGECGGFAPALGRFWAKNWLWLGYFRMRGYNLAEKVSRYAVTALVLVRGVVVIV